MLVFDFYSGFEGKGELRILRKSSDGATISVILIWVGFFDIIMNKIEPSEKEWEGVLLYYHLHTGWYEEENWECKEVELFIEQLESFDHNYLDKDCKEVLDVLLSELREAVRLRHKVFFEDW